MKSFLEEYGFAILAAIVVILLIAMCTPVGNTVKNQVLNVVERFASTADKKQSASDANTTSANIMSGTLYVQSASKTDKYHYVIHGTIKGELVVLDNTGARVSKVEDGSELTGSEAVKEVSLASTVAGLDEGSVYYVEVINDGTGYVFTSNIVTKTDATTGETGGESGPTYEIVDGDKDGKHYHNDALFTGTCGGKEYVDGVLKPTTLTAQEFADNSSLISGTIAKGNLITINSAEYRILSVNGTEIKVLAMDGESVTYNSSNVTTSFNGTTGQKYEGSNLDNVMTTFYNNMPAGLKQAVVAQNINQSMYKWNGTPADISSWYKSSFAASDISGTNYTLARTAEVNVGTRYVYALDVDDIKEYLGSSFTPQQLNNMFFKTTSSTSKYVWLRSAYADNSNYAFRVYGDYGFLYYLSNYSSTYGVRPAFILDLSKLG